MVVEEYIVFVRSHGNPLQGMTFQEQKKHIKDVGDYMRMLEERGILTSSHVFKKEELTLTAKDGIVNLDVSTCSDHCLAGFYHISAVDRDSAIRTVELDPRLQTGDWSLEIKPVAVMK